MRILHYDCFAGISGDMNLGALIDIGVDSKKLVAELEKLGIDSWKLSVSREMRGGLSGVRVNVETPETHAGSHGEGHKHCHLHRSFADIKKIIGASSLSDSVKSRALTIFSYLAEAESSVHGVSPDDVRFHEVGAVDSIIDIVGCAVCYELLKIDSVSSSAVELGGGVVRCAHGLLPVPAPATAILAKKFPSKINGAMHECTTPTGAAIIAALAKSFDAPISGRIAAVGIGIGSRDFPELPNALRVLLYDTEEASPFGGGYPEGCSEETLIEFAANIDDMSAERISHLCGSLFAASALDVWQEGIFMKKGRAATKVCALARREDSKKILSTYFGNSSTLGVRCREVSRISLARESFFKKTPFGDLRAKRSFFNGVAREKIEFDEIRKIADETGMGMEEILGKIGDGEPKDR